VSFGTLALGAENQPATPSITITNCSANSASLYASGSDASSGSGPTAAHWTLDGTTQTCSGAPTPLGSDRYHLYDSVDALASATELSTSNTLLGPIGANGGSTHTLQISTACPGSSGGGTTMNMAITYLVTP
jgi:hypothetical protein